MKFFIKNFFSKCDQFRRKLRIWSHLLKNKSLMENFIFCAVLVLINGEFGNPKVVVDDGELTRNINQKTTSLVLQVCRCPLCDKCCRREYFFNKHLEYCESVR